MAGGGYRGGSTVIRIGSKGTFWPTWDGPDMRGLSRAEPSAEVTRQREKRLARKRKRRNKAAETRANNGAAATKPKVVKSASTRPKSKRSAQEFEAALKAALLAANPEG